MKKLIVMSALVIGGLGVRTADAQFRINVHLNLGSQPVYAPAPPPEEAVEQPVYNDDDYYYLPDVEAYYSVGEQCYYYYDGSSWISAAFLPGYYRNYDWRTAKRFEIRGSRPYLHHDLYRGKFGGYSNRADFYARAYPNRGGYDRDQFRGRDQYRNDDRSGFDRRGDRDHNNGYSQPAPDRNQGGYNRGGYDQDRNQNGYNQLAPDRNQGGGHDRGNNGQNRDRGNYGQDQNRGGNQQQPAQDQRGGRGNGQTQGGDNNSQPTNHRGGNDRSGIDEHFAANKMGVVQERNALGRPIR